ncbi:PucR family transcriptional regulator [Leucobacter sp. NPDC058333]|uniref:PucR family transcriptional regulator n=1 Tax=Leucobacter sp. NPDC058333 TaxID=3346450 RepID=UPI0036515EDB
MLFDDESVAAHATVPLATLLDAPAFAARLLSPAPTDITRDPEILERVRNAAVAASIVIDLTDPSRYVTPGDLLLITGLGLPDDAAAIAKYVSGIRDGGVAALVFGVEPVYDAVPDALVEACRSLEFPLIELPPHIHFAPITMHLNRALETERTRTLEVMNTFARRVTEAALQHGPAQRITSVLAQSGEGWALLRIDEDTYGGGPVPDSLDVDALFADLGARFDAQGRVRGAVPTAFTAVEVDGVAFEVTAHRITPGRTHVGVASPSAVLLLGRSPRLTSLDRTALLLAANIVSLVVQLPAEQSMAVDQLLMHLMVDSTQSRPGAGAGERFSRLVAHSFGGGTRAVHGLIAIRDPQQPRDQRGSGDTYSSDAGWLRRLLHTPFVEHRAKRVRAFVARPPSEAEFAQASALGWLFAVSGPREFDELQEAMLEAEELARAARHLGRHVNGADPGSAADAWPSSAIADPSVARVAAARWLAPLAGDERAEHRVVLEEWLRQHGSWDRTARAHGLHRNTVRRLVAESARLLARDLDDPIERARILLAFTALEAAA